MISTLPPEIGRLFCRLRRKIRFYLASEGGGLCLFRLGILFWISLLVDRFFEPMPWVRVLFLVAVALFWIIDITRSVILPVWRKIPDHTLAILLERRFPQLNDALLTLVEPEKKGESFSETEIVTDWEKLLAEVREKLLPELENLRFRPLFRLRPLIFGLLGALLMATSILGFAHHYPKHFQVWQSRFLQLSETPWPRLIQLEMDSDFASGTLKIVRGSDVTIRLRAGVTDPERHLSEALRTVYFSYRTEDGIRDRIAMERENETFSESGEWAEFSYTFRGVLKSFDFDVTAGDASARNLRLEVVDSPALAVELRLEYPKYTALTPKTVQPGTVQAIPAGTNVIVFGEANKPLVCVEVVSEKESISGNRAEKEKKTQTVKPVAENARKICVPLGIFTEDTTLSFTLHDTDGIQSLTPMKLILAREEDAVPAVAVNPWGIGDAITPNARIPMRGKVTDDYGLKNVCFVWQTERIPQDASAEVADAVETAKKVENVGEMGDTEDAPNFQPNGVQKLAEWDENTVPPVEFELNGEETALDLVTLGLREKDQFQIYVAAEDRNDLEDAGRRVGRSQPVMLEVVTPEQLRWKLEAREVVLSQLYDGICQEMRDFRETLASLDFEELEGELNSVKNTVNEADNNSDNDAAKTEEKDSIQSLMSYRTERVIQNNRKNSHEFNGIAEGIENVCLQMVNNRIDTPAWYERLENGIRKPLLEVHMKWIPELETTLTELRAEIDAGKVTEARTAHEKAGTQMDAILILLATVREKMLKMQDFNEMVELMRTVVRQEEELQTEIARENRSALADLLAGDDDDDDDDENDSENSDENGDSKNNGEKEAEKTVENGKDSARLPDCQKGILRTFNLWDEKIPQMLEILQNDAEHTELLREARKMSDEMRIRTRMEEIVAELEEESMSQASGAVKTLVPDLKKILERLETENRNQKIQSEAERLRAHLKELNQRIREQQSLSGRTRQVRDVAELAREQDTNAQKTGELARKITDEAEADKTPDSKKKEEAGTDSEKKPGNESAEGTDGNQDSSENSESSENTESSEGAENQQGEKTLSDALRQAQEKMNEAREKLEKTEREGALEAQREAQQELEEARAQLEQILRQLREEEAKRTLNQLETQLKTLIQLQRGIHDETRRLDGIPAEKRTREFTDETTRLSRREKELAFKAEMVHTQLREDGRARMLTEVLGETIHDMRRVTDLLANGQADAVTLELEASILDALEEMLAAVEESEKKLEEEKGQDSDAQATETDQDPALIDRIAELKMIRSAQVRIWKRTQNIGKLISDETTQDPQHLETLRDLSRQQEKIRKIIHEMATEK